MQYIDAKFKDSDPKVTVQKIKGILAELGIEVRERWPESGIENCHSVALSSTRDIPSYNGKGVTEDFARASAHAEFVERVQSGLYTTRYQSIIRDKEMDLHSYASDGKYMTVSELIQEGEWMDYIIDSYKDIPLTRESLARCCQAYACADDGKVWTIPFYSLFEKKHVYLPSAFVTRMYSANGNCAGNTKEEAWVHALSEMMERNASQKMIASGESVPQIPEEVLQKFPVVSKILSEIRESGDFDVAVFDYSLGNGFPVVATRVINKRDQNYLVNIAADPILEIAIQRTFTELFQGRGLKDLAPRHNARILNKVTDFSVADNVLNQVQTSDGMYTADFFANELTCHRQPTEFVDNSNKTNKELLTYALDIYKKMGKPVYVRNYSYLGFPSYKFVVPGFSETRAVCLGEVVPEYALGDSAREAFKNAPAATNEDLEWLLMYSATTKNLYSRYYSFDVNAGIPIVGPVNKWLINLTRAYASYRVKKMKDAIAYLDNCIRILDKDNEMRKYFVCVNKYLQMKVDGISEEKIRVILYKFFRSEYPDALYEKLDNGQTPYDDYLLRCEITNCDSCRYQENCRYHDLRRLTNIVGERYKTFVDGQASTEFEYES